MSHSNPFVTNQGVVPDLYCLGVIVTILKKKAALIHLEGRRKLHKARMGYESIRSSWKIIAIYLILFFSISY